MAKKNSEFMQVLFRLQELGIQNQLQLSQVLGISPGGVSDAKKRGNFPKGWAVKLSVHYGRSVDWILGINFIEADPLSTETSVNEIMRLQKKLIESRDAELVAKEEIIQLQRKFGESDKALLGSQTDVLELKNQINYLEGTVSLLREEVEAVKLASAKKKEQGHLYQQEGDAEKGPVQQVA